MTEDNVKKLIFAAKAVCEMLDGDIEYVELEEHIDCIKEIAQHHTELNEEINKKMSEKVKTVKSIDIISYNTDAYGVTEGANILKLEGDLLLSCGCKQAVRDCLDKAPEGMNFVLMERSERTNKKIERYYIENSRIKVIYDDGTKGVFDNEGAPIKLPAE